MSSTGKTVRIISALVFSAAVLLAVMPRSAKFPYEYKKGTEWAYETLYSGFDFPILKSEAEIQREWAFDTEVMPYYRFSDELVSRSVDAARDMDLGVLSAPVVSELGKIFNRGVIADEAARSGNSGAEPEVIYIQRDKHAAMCPFQEVWTLSAARSRMRDDMEALDLGFDVDSVLKDNGVYSLIVPNLIYDSQATALLSSNSDKARGVTSGYVSAGELIVSKGELITSEIAQMLDSYRKEYDANLGYAGPVFLFWLGNGLIAIALLTLLFFSIYLSDPSIFNDSRFLYIVMVYLITAVGAILLCKAEIYSYFFAPFTLSALFLHAFFRPKVILSVYSVSLIPMLVFAPSGPELYVMFLLSGLVGVYAFRTMSKGWKQFLAALIMFSVEVLVFLGFRLSGLVEARIFWSMSYLLVGSFITVVGYALVPLFELIFNLVSNSRLLDLCDLSNSLVRELEQKAPGTFQHSLQVMNMAEYTARAVDANGLLLRAGALYHDIGKINNPLCFVENESLLNKSEEEKYHHSLSLQQSSKDIIRHVTDGVEMAQRHHMPQVIIDFILTHHGTSHTGYFYNKFLSDGGDPAFENDFRYPGKKPSSKEQVILMLCDSIEAASRSLTEYTPEAYSEFVEKIVNNKRAEGQLNESDITLKEISTFKRVVKEYLHQMHHGRIAYPENKGSNRNKIKKHQQ